MGGQIEIHLDGQDGPLIGVCDVTNTDEWHNWATFSCPVQAGQPVEGVHALTLVFKGRGGRLFNLKSFAFCE